MERLTESAVNGVWSLKGVSWQQLAEGAVITKELRQKLYGALCKLKAYEDTELTTDDVIRVNEFEGSNAELLLVEKAKHKWFLPSERLPESSEELVLIQVSGKPTLSITLKDAMELAIYSETEGWILEEYPEWRRPEVIAWRPLPEPYKEE